ncbi:DNA topoisomerase VI subunit B [Ignicoccus hospitalis]|uniref:Type 2 DNA topoisomerase 6 subunit B n=1 Tax=Ignicoccus hospitalis (strain KIN4/I / DSM 18386 / JCM 14125) TaxID=453591 RepID=A8ABG5_IGNH4|nr:DNA topoisomerase VI subunit B [Ignicoccus hospitalis]ABU82267.1 DNA topoisomerase VI, B subunit [Ignicoccus hospitalis KIN4/I]HIH90814.1 DNA topoisomerase VI subunit B [Desulfurococcaceae archaeon]
MPKQRVQSERGEERFKAIGPAEFFFRNIELTGFDNYTRAIFQTVKEMLDNSLDATETHGILPRITIVIERLNEAKASKEEEEKKEIKGSKDGIYRITVDDNGIGVPQDKIPYAFGRMLYSSKYVERQTRGTYGLGVKAAVLYAQKTTGEPATVISSPIKDKMTYRFKVSTNISTNEPDVKERGSWTKSGDWHGTRVSVIIEGNWRRARSKVVEYVRRTAIVAPYADITLITPDGTLIRYPRRTKEMPKPPKEVKPHPLGIDIETMKRIAQLTTAKTLLQMLTTEFQAVGAKTAKAILSMAGLEPDLEPKKLTEEQIKALVNAMKEYGTTKRYKAPSKEALSPIGEKLIKIGLKSMLNPEFVTAVSRRPSSYSGHPFVVEVGIAYGGEIPPSDAPVLLRYANKTPLLYNERNDVSWKVVSELNWKNYEVSFPAPLVVLVHVASTKVPFKDVSKDTIADVPEIEAEIRLALQEAARRLKRFIIKKRKEEELAEKVITFLKYVPEIARSLKVLSVDPETRKPTVSEEEIEEKLKKLIAKKLGVPEDKLPEVVIGIE